jgi:hypothetical protein
MNSKFLQPRCKTPLLVINLLKNNNNYTIRCLSSVLFTRRAEATDHQNRLSAKLCNKQTVCIFKLAPPILTLSCSRRGALRGGPGYTHFAHGRKKLDVSLYGKFYIAFLFSSFLFAVFFDWDSFLYRGQLKKDYLADVQMLKGDTIRFEPKSTKAKEITSDSLREIDSDDSGDETAVETSGKKSKNSFRERKVCLEI